MPRYHKIREIRLKLGIAQVTLARRLGVKPPTVATWEKRDDMLVSTLLKISDALGCSPAELLPATAPSKRKKNMTRARKDAKIDRHEIQEL